MLRSSARSIAKAVLLGAAIGAAFGLACEVLSARVIAKSFQSARSRRRNCAPKLR